MSLGPGMGGLITLASYNRFNNNCYHDALIVVAVNCVTSLVAGFVVFSTIGFLAHQMGVHVSEVITSGPELAFVVYPEVLSRLPAAPLFSVLFFLMLFTLGLDSQFTLVETVTTALFDELPSLRAAKAPLIAAVCLGLFMAGAPFCMQNGLYIFTLYETFGAAWGLVGLSVVELLVVCYVYGLRNLQKDVELMLGKKYNGWARIFGNFGWYWRINWWAITPISITVIMVGSLVQYALQVPSWKIRTGTGNFTEVPYGLPEFALAGFMMMMPLYLVAGFAALAICQMLRGGHSIRWLFVLSDGYHGHAARQMNKRARKAARQLQRQHEPAPLLADGAAPNP